MPSATRVSNIILRVRDLGRSLEFYRDRLGLSVRFASPEFAGLDGGGVMLLLNQPEHLPGEENAGLVAATEVVFEADDLPGTYHAWKERGVPFRIEPRMVTTDGTRDLHAADFVDPDGHRLSLTGWLARKTEE